MTKKEIMLAYAVCDYLEIQALNYDNDLLLYAQRLKKELNNKNEHIIFIDIYDDSIIYKINDNTIIFRDNDTIEARDKATNYEAQNIQDKGYKFINMITCKKLFKK